LIGFGRIGKRVAQLAQAFGMTVTAIDPFAKPDAMTALGVEPSTDKDASLARADYVSLHVPSLAGGPVIGERELALMKPSAILINAARGGLIDEQALDAALNAGKLYAAAMDVLVEEPPSLDHPLLKNPKFTLSPHAAGLTAECAARMAQSAAQNILDCFAGRLDAGLVVNGKDIV
jgi:D-3-phosphoglycerate dehydrogenase